MEKLSTLKQMLFFDNVKLPLDFMLGEEGRGFAHMMLELPRERLGCAVQAVGHMQGALDMTVQYVQERKAFGHTIVPRVPYRRVLQYNVKKSPIPALSNC